MYRGYAGSLGRGNGGMKRYGGGIQGLMLRSDRKGPVGDRLICLEDA